ncbi:translation initiation factor IF-2 [Listeria ivanovii]|uniref:Translation initiation factor IF-2 n=1 Tax=Listeria ivanovii (strain ATCC BAA-678 / PAM 55) TaxID=881621 RepID=G2ZFN5_LISIP|nr:translation initiation factor IF-2 [Listeria ivanovii]AHI55821.1 translation initiation factor IF-2 [Listeria ivanovii WSLC3009]AIS65265.1 translation initiation factor IF-2 [Listeria ivanovii subsp. ivanovii]MBC1760075.1 translation initiation factor IF-2 [Listeria ivanovii]MBK3914582.1 translation initiation factor IF-2 [Listeria ivanovii subsp. ivanovii]MBK3921520.1 translation initiation factor IF-2 [Listeria ivanovii subsp. ivanovii]
MSKVRVYEYAKEHQVSSKKVIEALKDLGIEVANHMSTINENALRQLDKAVDGTNKKAEAPKKETTSNENGNSKGPNKLNMTNSNEKSSKPNKPAGQNTKPATTNKSQGAKPASTKPANTTNQTQTTGNQQTGGPKRNNNNSNRPGGGNSNRPGGNNRPNRGGNFNNKGRNTKKKGKLNHSTVPPTPPKPKELPEKIVFSESLTVAELAKKLYREPSELIKKLFMLGVVATINQSLDKDAIELICSDYGVAVEEEIKVDITDLDVYFENELNEAVDEAKLVERPPVVTIMGHVDHGKTTLLDSLRNTKVTLGEAGGITQHIGAYQLEIHDKKITFLDTPGHAAFTAMRARGAQITDITILVVAADDGVMPQTIEAINHAKAAGMPIIVAVNKIDKPQANPDRVMQELTEYELVPEAWGGDTIFAPISAKFGEGLENLLDMILLVSEVEELKANPDRRAIGSVIEAELDKGRGPVATLLVQDGTLNIGDPIVVGNTFGRVRAMVNDLGRRVKKVGPSTPVEITGLNDVPQAGDRFVVFEDEKTARNIGETRASRALVAQRSATNRVSLDNLFEHMKAGEMKEVNVIIKADVQGSVEALAASLRKIDVEGVNVKIIHTAVGAINESDITLAAASNAIVIGFNVRPTTQAREAAENESVDIRLHRVIYKAIDEIEAAMKGMLDPEFQEKIIGQAQVRQTINVSKVGTIAGCFVTDGKITRDSGVRIIRDGIVVFEGEIATLKRFKDDAKEVAKGYECGITVQNFNDIKEDDVIEAYVMEEIERK